MSTTKTTGAGLAVKLIGTCEAARILGVHRNTIGHWAENGILRARVLPSGTRRFDPGEVESVRARIHPRSPHDAPRFADPVLWPLLPAGTERQIMHRVDRGGVLIGERELRHQLERKDNHPLARSDELLDVLAGIEARGLITAELCFRLTAQGRARLGDLDTSGSAES